MKINCRTTFKNFIERRQAFDFAKVSNNILKFCGDEMA